MAFPPKFLEAVQLVAKAIDQMKAKGYPEPTLVGGAAAELYTAGAIASADFDFVTSHQQELFEELRTLGFDWKIANEGRLVLHPRLGFVVEVVSPWLLEGKADKSKVQTFDVGEGLHLNVIGLEDLIADRPEMPCTKG